MQVATTAPRVARPGTSRARSRDGACARCGRGSSSTPARTCPPTSARSTEGSSGIRPDLEAAAQVDAHHVGEAAPRGRGVMRVTRFHTSGSVPEPMWVWSPRMVSPVARGQAQDLVEVLVPDPEARAGAAGIGAVGGRRCRARGSSAPTPRRPGATRPNSSSWCSEQALKSTPRARCSASRRDGICEVSWIASGVKPRAARAPPRNRWRRRGAGPGRGRSRGCRALGLAFIA